MTRKEQKFSKNEKRKSVRNFDKEWKLKDYNKKMKRKKEVCLKRKTMKNPYRKKRQRYDDKKQSGSKKKKWR